MNSTDTSSGDHTQRLISCEKCGHFHSTDECPHYLQDRSYGYADEKKGCCNPCWCAVGGCIRKRMGLFNGELCVIS
jgi:hypothetical protein